MGVLFMALSCIKTNGLDEVPEGEICMSPVLSDMVRTRTGNGTTPYPEGRSFGVFAYYSDTEAGNEWTTTSPEEYFTNYEFSRQGEICSGVEPVYWPFSGSLVFAGYSPYDKAANVDYDVSSKTLSITDYEVNGNDLMYFLPELTDEKYVGYDKEISNVPVTFNHALSCVFFSIVEGVGGQTVTLKEIKLLSVYTQGNFSVSALEPTNVIWNNLTESDLVVWNESRVLSSEALEVYAFVIPSAAKSIMITYRIAGEAEDRTKTIDPDKITDWELGTRNHYAISINSMGEVELNPTVQVFHNYDGEGVLYGSRVVVDLGLSDADMERINNLIIEVRAADNGFVYKRYTSADVTSNTIIFDSGEKLYLPQENDKEYNVVFSYHDGLSQREVTSVVVPPEPVFAMNLDVLTRPYSNSRWPAQIVVRNANLTISDDVLKEIAAKVVIQFGSTSYRRFGSENVTTSHFIQNNMQPIGVWSGNVTTETSEVEFDGVVLDYNETFYVPSGYRRKANPITNASQLKDGAKYVICSDANTGYYWYNGGSFMYSTITNTANISVDYVFIYARDDSKKRGDLDKRYSYSSAGAWITNYDWTYLNDSFQFTSSPSYFTCANGWRNDQNSGLIESKDIDIYHINRGASDMLNRNWNYVSTYPSGYFWGNGGIQMYKWNIYEVEEY